MSEVNPALQVYDQASNPADTVAVADTNRLTVLTRNAGGTRAILPQAGRATAADTYHVNFMNGADWDLRTDGSGTAKMYSISAGDTTQVVVSVSLLVIFTRVPVLNGACFGSQYMGGLLGATTITPNALPNGLQLTCSAAGVTTALVNLTVNEEMALGPGGPQFGSLGGPFLMRTRYDVNQTLTGGSADRLTWTVRDDMTSRGITEIRAVATAVAPL